MNVKQELQKAADVSQENLESIAELKKILADARAEREAAEKELQKLQETRISPSMVEVKIPQIPSETPSQTPSQFGSKRRRSKRRSRKNSRKSRRRSKRRSKKNSRKSKRRSKRRSKKNLRK